MNAATRAHRTKALTSFEWLPTGASGLARPRSPPTSRSVYLQGDGFPLCGFPGSHNTAPDSWVPSAPVRRPAAEAQRLPARPKGQPGPRLGAVLDLAAMAGRAQAGKRGCELAQGPLGYRGANPPLQFLVEGYPGLSEHAPTLGGQFQQR